MKKLIITSIIMFLSFMSFGQVYKDMVFESDLNKDLLYTNAKLFIAENFRSSNNVIQLDDKENGVILVKGIIVEDITQSLQNLTYHFSFTMKILIKDNKYRLIIENVNNTTAPYKYNTIEINNFRGMFSDNLSKSKYDELMLKLNSSIDDLTKRFESSMKKKTINSDW